MHGQQNIKNVSEKIIRRNMDGPAENRIQRNLAFDLAHTSVYQREGHV